MALAPLKDRINQKILGLEFHLSYVENKEREFQEVQRTLRQEPEKLVVNGKVKLLVGDGWFTEQSLEDSLGFVKRRLDKLAEEIGQINSNLDSARKAVADLEKLDFDEDVQKEAREDDRDEYTTADGLPMMDIREELDEDGNVMASSVEPQKKDHDLKDFAEKHLTRVIQQREEDIKNEWTGTTEDQGETYDNEGYKLVDGKRVYGPPRPPPKDGSKEKTQDQPKSILKKPSNAHASSSTLTPKSLDKPPESMKRFMGQTDGSIPQESGRISEVAEEDASEQQQSRDDTYEGSENSVENSKENQKNNDSSEPVEQPVLRHHHHSIDTEDLLQLELIANDLTENEEDMHFDGVGWDFEEDYEEEDEEEDEYGRSSVGYEILTPDEIEKRTKAAEAAALEAKNNRQASPDSTGKKQVRFSSEVEINRFDKTRVSHSESHTESGVLAASNEPERQEKKKRVSRFKAERIENKSHHAPSIGPEKVVPNVQEQGPVGDIMERHDTGSSQASIPGQSMDKGIVGDIKESATHLNSSRIEKTPVNNVKEHQRPVTSPMSSERKTPVSDIMERVTPDANEAKSVSKEGKTSLSSQTNETSRRNIFTIPSNAATPSKNQKIPPALLRQPEKLKQVKAQTPTTIPGMVGEETIVPIEVSEEQQINDTVNNVASTIKPQDVFSKEVYDLAREHFKNAVVTEEQFVEAHDRESDHEDDDEEPRQDQTDSRPILTTNIRENPTSTTPIPPSFLDTMDDSDSDEDFSVNMAQVSAEYHRIRNKLIQKTGGYKQSDTEKEFESLDDDGNPIKVSRFKAARLSNRSI